MKTYEKKLKKLENLYSEAEQRLIKIIATKEAKGQAVQFYKELLNEVKLELAKTQFASVKLSKDVVNELYLEALEKGYKELLLDISPTLTSLHKEAIEILVDNLVQNFSDVNNMVGRQIDDVLREIGLNEASNKFATGQTLKQMQKEVVNKLLSENILGIKDKRGRIIPYTTYAEILCRSIVAETQNTSILNLSKEHGNDLVKMTEHKTSCPVCQKYEGKVYSVSGKDSRYQSLNTIPGFNKGYNNIHPRCRHRISIFIEKYGRSYDMGNTANRAIENNKTNIVDELKNKGVEIDTTLNKIDKKLFDRNLGQLNDIIDKYPKIEDYIKKNKFTVKAGQIKGANASCEANSKKDSITLVLNNKHYSDYNLLVKSKKETTESGWSSKCVESKMDVYTITHEIGHAIHEIMIKEYNKNNPKALEKTMEKALKAKTLSAGRKIMIKHDYDIVKAFNKEIINISKSIDKDFNEKESVSKYGKTTPLEFFAECFASAECGELDTYGKAMNIFLERNFK